MNANRCVLTAVALGCVCSVRAETLGFWTFDGAPGEGPSCLSLRKSAARAFDGQWRDVVGAEDDSERASGTLTTGWGRTPVTGSAQLAWNDTGLFVRVTVEDRTHVHTAFDLGRQRNDNDTLQLGFDTLDDALIQATDGCNQDDYEYAVFPDASASGAITWANRVADCQMTGRFGQQGDCFIPEIPSSFVREDGRSVYTVFIPADRLAPGKLQKGAKMGLGLIVTNAEDEDSAYGHRVVGGASLGQCTTSSVGNPRAWAEIVFEE